MDHIQFPDSPLEVPNFLGGAWQPGSGPVHEIRSPWTGMAIGKLYSSNASDVAAAVEAAKGPAKAWGELSLKDRTAVMFRFRDELLARMEPIAHSVSSESGKLLAESKAGLMKGIEVLEFALSLQNLDDGGKMIVSSGVTCEYRREPLGIVAGITPFNFPAMVPMWMIPLAITVGNAFVWKPSDKTPMTSLLIAEAAKAAGLPDGVLSIVQGGREAVEAICDHPDIKAVAFVGSTPVARSVYVRATSNGKRALCLGGAKNHIILMPDADPEMAASGILASFTGCAGQRCMASSVVIGVGDVDDIVAEMAQRAASMELGRDMGAIITTESLSKLRMAVQQAGTDGAEILADGRSSRPKQSEFESGNWIGPSILDHVKPGSQAACDELFGPVLSIVRLKNLSEALALENTSPYGNAASVFTSSGAVAEEVAKHAHAGMIGVNIGVPVPREPFSFGGFSESRFGHGDITGMDGVAFWSRQKKVTQKWSLQKDQNWMN